MGLDAVPLRAEVGRLQRVGSGDESWLLGAAIERPLLAPESPSEPRPRSTATVALQPIKLSRPKAVMGRNRPVVDDWSRPKAATRIQPPPLA